MTRQGLIVRSHQECDDPAQRPIVPYGGRASHRMSRASLADSGRLLEGASARGNDLTSPCESFLGVEKSYARYRVSACAACPGLARAELRRVCRNFVCLPFAAIVLRSVRPRCCVRGRWRAARADCGRRSACVPDTYAIAPVDAMLGRGAAGVTSKTSANGRPAIRGSRQTGAGKWPLAPSG